MALSPRPAAPSLAAVVQVPGAADLAALCARALRSSAFVWPLARRLAGRAPVCLIATVAWRHTPAEPSERGAQPLCCWCRCVFGRRSSGLRVRSLAICTGSQTIVSRERAPNPWRWMRNTPLASAGRDIVRAWRRSLAPSWGRAAGKLGGRARGLSGELGAGRRAGRQQQVGAGPARARARPAGGPRKSTCRPLFARRPGQSAPAHRATGRNQNDSI